MSNVRYGTGQWSFGESYVGRRPRWNNHGTCNKPSARPVDRAVECAHCHALDTHDRRLYGSGKSPLGRRMLFSVCIEAGVEPMWIDVVKLGRFAGMGFGNTHHIQTGVHASLRSSKVPRGERWSREPVLGYISS